MIGSSTAGSCPTEHYPPSPASVDQGISVIQTRQLAGLCRREWEVNYRQALDKAKLTPANHSNP